MNSRYVVRFEDVDWYDLRILDRDQPLTCDACHGTGRVAQWRQPWPYQRRCTQCGGKGRLSRRLGTDCGKRRIA